LIERVDFQQRIIRSIEPISRPLRAAFRAGYTSQVMHYLPARNEVRGSKGAGQFVIVAHVRRGDILHSRRIDREHRLVSVHVYIDILKQVLLAMKKVFFKYTLR
jgi:hypothetical protein